jgi:hypothetical protein
MENTVGTPWAPLPEVAAVEKRFAASLPIYRDVMTILDVQG